MTPTEILAEPGSTHMGRRDWMQDLIGIALDAGCDAVKWQWLSSAPRLCRRRQAPAYLQAYQLIEGDCALLEWMVEETHKAGLKAIVTAYLPEDVAVIGAMADAVKIASFEAGDGMLLRMAAQTGRSIYVSTGMMDAADVQGIFNHCEPAVLFHCASVYPAPPCVLNLRVLTQWDRAHRNYRIGFSDHSAAWVTGAVAVAAGAETLEVHYRHPQTPETNADYATALPVPGLARYVEFVRLTETMLGDGRKQAQPGEAAMQAYRVRI